MSLSRHGVLIISLSNYVVMLVHPQESIHPSEQCMALLKPFGTRAQQLVNMVPESTIVNKVAVILFNELPTTQFREVHTCSFICRYGRAIYKIVFWLNDKQKPLLLYFFAIE